jgi:hypothetical protein
MLVGCHLSVPVATPDPVGTAQKPLEQEPRRRVDHDFREVLAADEVDVINSQIYGGYLVAGRAVRSLPLDHDRAASSQAVGRLSEGDSVGPCLPEIAGEGSTVVSSLE